MSNQKFTYQYDTIDKHNDNLIIMKNKVNNNVLICQQPGGSGRDTNVYVLDYEGVSNDCPVIHATKVSTLNLIQYSSNESTSFYDAWENLKKKFYGQERLVSSNEKGYELIYHNSPEFADKFLGEIKPSTKTLLYGDLEYMTGSKDIVITENDMVDKMVQLVNNAPTYVTHMTTGFDRGFVNNRVAKPRGMTDGFYNVAAEIDTKNVQVYESKSNNELCLLTTSDISGYNRLITYANVGSCGNEKITSIELVDKTKMYERLTEYNDITDSVVIYDDEPLMRYHDTMVDLELPLYNTRFDYMVFDNRNPSYYCCCETENDAQDYIDKYIMANRGEKGMKDRDMSNQYDSEMVIRKKLYEFSNKEYQSLSDDLKLQSDKCIAQLISPYLSDVVVAHMEMKLDAISKGESVDYTSREVVDKALIIAYETAGMLDVCDYPKGFSAMDNVEYLDYVLTNGAYDYRKEIYNSYYRGAYGSGKSNEESEAFKKECLGKELYDYINGVGTIIEHATADELVQKCELIRDKRRELAQTGLFHENMEPCNVKVVGPDGKKGMKGRELIAKLDACTYNEKGNPESGIKSAYVNFQLAQYNGAPQTKAHLTSNPYLTPSHEYEVNGETRKSHNTRITGAQLAKLEANSKVATTQKGDKIFGFKADIGYAKSGEGLFPNLDTAKPTTSRTFDENAWKVQNEKTNEAYQKEQQAKESRKDIDVSGIEAQNEVVATIEGSK